MPTTSFRCPSCRGALEPTADGVRCVACGAAYGALGSILDLRLTKPSWIDFDEDRALAQRLWDMGPDAPLERLVDIAYRARGGAVWTEREVKLRTRRVLEATERLHGEFDGWLRPALEGDGAVLDLGCGPGMLLAALARRNRRGVGIDVSLASLVLADRLIRAQGGVPELAAGFAESLPFSDATFSRVLSLDVIEHVGDQAAYLSEIDRVATPNGHVFLATPNRFSLSPEPHVGVWGVGMLPRPLQKSYVRWASGKPYDFIRLLSAREIGQLFRRHTHFEVEIRTPPIPPAELARFTGPRARLASIYNGFAGSPAGKLLLLCGAFFHIIGTKAGSPT